MGQSYLQLVLGVGRMFLWTIRFTILGLAFLWGVLTRKKTRFRY